DGRRSRIPTLQKRNPSTKALATGAVTNKKSTMFHGEFSPLKMLTFSVLQNTVYLPPAYEWKPLSDALIHCTIARLKPYKATKPSTFPNCIYIYNTDLPVLYLGVLFWSLNKLEFHPLGWNHIDTLVLRKPGKMDYANPAAH
ncbi:hypothetical protein B0H10DRAFT_1663020, partial [Mycena sp. CBHHK59/15]